MVYCLKICIFPYTWSIVQILDTSSVSEQTLHFHCSKWPHEYDSTSRKSCLHWQAKDWHVAHVVFQCPGIASLSDFERFQLRFRIDIMNPPTQTTSNFWTMTLLDHFAKPIPSFNLWKFPEISVSTYARNSAPSCYLGDCVGAGQGIAIPILRWIGTRN